MIVSYSIGEAAIEAEAKAESCRGKERDHSVNERLSQTLSQINVLEAQTYYVFNLCCTAPMHTTLITTPNHLPDTLIGDLLCIQPLVY
uniref:Uncharacterized protein n=1 Tax=Tanacetum cinerariifolium TaxID=118510 RepID=A0A6L2L9A0_TANCI|nr:hypothetical protein [Tanacetum cinerariifolium]